jgi:hypothetical protein
MEKQTTIGTNHYGVYVDINTPITGVINTNKPEWLHEDMYNGIDLDFEEHLKECKNEYHDDCYFNDETTYLIGFKFDEKSGKYEVDYDAEYSAIVSQIYTQIVHSKTIKENVGLCSPCFPGQADLDSKGNFKAYDLPKDVYGENNMTIGTK